MPDLNAKPMGLIDALEQGDGYAHVASWDRGTYIFIRGSDLSIHLNTSGYDKPFSLTWNKISNVIYHPGKGLPRCESCKDADELEEEISRVPLGPCVQRIALKLIKHLRSSESCKCEGS